MNPYILNCKCFADAMNQLRFPLHVPEYYEPAIPSYFRKPIDNPKPIVNGEEVEWEEYMESHDVTPPKSIIPNMIYKAEDLNQAYSMKTPVDIMDLIDNEVEFTFVRFQDVELVINIFDGYYDEIKDYIQYSNDLRLFIERMRSSRFKLEDIDHQGKVYQRNTHPEQRGPVTLYDIIKRMQ